LLAARREVEALAAWRHALVLKPDAAAVHNNLGHLYFRRGEIDMAIGAFRQAVHFAPEMPEAHNNLGNALYAAERLDDAIASWREALRLRKDYLDAFNNLANGLKMRGRLDEAISASKEALRCDPASAEARLNLGNVLLVKREFQAAEAEFRQALRLRPRYAEAHNNLGNALSGRGEIDAAITAYQNAVELAPNYADGHANLGSMWKMQGNLDSAISAYRRAMELAPEASEPHSNLIYALCFHPDYHAKSILEECVAWDQCHAQRLAGRIRPHHTDRGQDRRLRIGYVSPDFRDHVIGRNVFPLFREHDHQRFEIYGYSNVALPDETTGRFRALADVWRNISGLNDSQAAAMIRADKIDILVDLALHLSRNRLLVFAYKPAPVQVTFAGYPGGTGLETMDFRLTDPHLDPPGETDGDYREKSIRLPDSFWCYDPEAMTFGLESEPRIGELPAGRRGDITFGYLGNFCKVNATALRLWAAILRATDRSRLLLLAPEGSHRQRVMDVFAEEDVDSSRVSFALPCKRAEYLRYYDCVDIELDTTPYNGHTTSLDALWMGAPVVTLVGKTVAGRAGLSQARNLGLTDLVANSPEEYVRIAADLAADRSRLGSLRGELRDRMRQSPLTDARKFTRGVEAAYEQMWRGA
jgi:predicted O-linked N-acetylglucosamine transferase (SPINDLY family)